MNMSVACCSSAHLLLLHMRRSPLTAWRTVGADAGYGLSAPPLLASGSRPPSPPPRCGWWPCRSAHADCPVEEGGRMMVRGWKEDGKWLDIDSE